MELRKILTEMGSEPFEPEKADEVINEISFDKNGLISQDGIYLVALSFRIAHIFGNNIHLTHCWKMDVKVSVL